jgi:hypothetical protein
MLFERFILFYGDQLDPFPTVFLLQAGSITNLGPDRACKVRARALHCGLWLLRAWPGLVGGLRVWTVDLAQKPGPRGLGLLGYVVKARACMALIYNSEYKSSPSSLPPRCHLNTCTYPSCCLSYTPYF